MIQLDLERSLSNGAIKEKRVVVGMRTIERYRASWEEYRQVYVASENKGGRPKVLQNKHINELHRFLASRPIAYLDEMCLFLQDKLHVFVDEFTVWRALTKVAPGRSK